MSELYYVEFEDTDDRSYAQTYYFDSKVEAKKWLDAISDLYDRKEDFATYSFSMGKVRVTKLTLEAFLGERDNFKCGECERYFDSANLHEGLCYPCQNAP